MEYKNNECQTTGTNHFVISSNSSKKSEDKRHNYIFLIRSGNAVTISFWQEDTFLVSFGSCSLGTADRPKSREKRKISNDTQIQAEKQRIRVNVVWEPLFQHYNGNVDHFFFSPFIYFSCIRSNWNYTPYVYYMTFMRLDQCRRWVYLKLLHKPSAYEKRVFFSLSSFIFLASLVFFTVFLPFHTSFLSLILLSLLVFYICFHYVLRCALAAGLSGNFIYLYSSTVKLFNAMYTIHGIRLLKMVAKTISTKAIFFSLHLGKRRKNVQ